MNGGFFSRIEFLCLTLSVRPTAKARGWALRPRLLGFFADV